MSNLILHRSCVIACALIFAVCEFNATAARASAAKISGSAIHPMPFSAEPPISVDARLNKESAAIAEPIELLITIDSPDNVLVAFPESGERVGDFDVIDVEDHLDIPTPLGRQSTRRYLVESIETGEQTIPSINIAYVDRRTANPTSGELQTVPQSIVIGSLLAADEQPTQFRGIKDAVLIDIPKPVTAIGKWLALAAAGIVVLATIIWRIVWMRPMTPEQWALRMIGRLENSKDAEAGRYERVYESASDVLREYMHRRLDLSAPWLTTVEFLDQSRDDDRLSQAVQERLEEFLMSADMVKFASLCCDRELFCQAMDKARDFIVECDVSATRSTPTRDLSMPLAETAMSATEFDSPARAHSLN